MSALLSQNYLSGRCSGAVKSPSRLRSRADKKATWILPGLIVFLLVGYSDSSEAGSDDPTKVTVRCGEHQGDDSDGCSYYGQINDGSGSTDINDWGQQDYSIVGQTVKVSVQRDGTGEGGGYYLEIWIYAGSNEVAYSICKHNNQCSTDAAYSSTGLGAATSGTGTFVLLFVVLGVGGFVFYNYFYKKRALSGFEIKSKNQFDRHPEANVSPNIQSPPPPPLPPEGLPDGWTMEQWEHYGHEYIQKSRMKDEWEID